MKIGQRARSLATGCLLLIGGAACVSTAPRSAPTPADAARTTLDVSNNNWADMVIYAVQADSRQRLGTVTSMSTAHLKLPHALETPGTDLRLMADPVGGKERYSTDPIRVSPGQRVQLTIENNLAISSYSVWSR